MTFRLVRVFISCVLWLMVATTVLRNLLLQTMANKQLEHESLQRITNHLDSSSSSLSLSSILMNCTFEQFNVIQSQLPPDACLRWHDKPWLQRCSLTTETKCPDATWLDDYYHHLHHQQQQQQEEAHDSFQKKSSFVGISVGCNKAFDAIDTMRRASANPLFDKSTWKHALEQASVTAAGSDGQSSSSSSSVVARGVCHQESKPQYAIPSNHTIVVGLKTRSVQMYCIEPMPLTVAALQKASMATRYNEHGLLISHAAIARSNGIAYFPTATTSSGNNRTTTHMSVKVGAENKGLDNCPQPTTSQGKRGGRIHNHPADNPHCQAVPMYTLDTFTTKYVFSAHNNNTQDDDAIHMLSIDVEGYDFDVLLGGMNETLPRVEYLEFEYNWMGSWRKQSLADAITQLDQLLNFTCYWAGSAGRLWRITACFMDYYEMKHWSNVACVNRKRVPDLATRMEMTFLQTLAATTTTAAAAAAV